jgi:hypothetical protein
VDRGEPPGFSIHVDECVSLDAIAPLPVNREGGLVVFDVEWFGVPIAGQLCGELIGRLNQPRIARLGGLPGGRTSLWLSSEARDVGPASVVNVDASGARGLRQDGRTERGEDALNAIESGCELTRGLNSLNQAWKAASEPERRTFCRKYYEEMNRLGWQQKW